jgi:archaellum component FlaG (FlaF/FlaG flagellin family)
MSNENENFNQDNKKREQDVSEATEQQQVENISDSKRQNINKNSEKKISGLAITSLVLGIVGLSLSPLPIINNASAVLGAIGIIFGIIGIVKTRKNKGEKRGKGLAIAGLITSIVTIVIVLSLQSSWSQSLNKVSDSLNKATGNKTEDIINKDVSVEFNQYNIETKSYSGFSSKEGYLQVVVKNLTNTSKTFNVQIQAVDSAGNRINDDYITINNLDSGQSKTSKIFNAFTDDAITKYQNASFTIVKVSES